MIVGEGFQLSPTLALHSRPDLVYNTTLTQPCRRILFISQKAESIRVLHRREMLEIPLRLPFNQPTGCHPCLFLRQFALWFLIWTD